ncbi:MAG: hypothetical protein Q9157_005174 [Trypethelium eluteriae]
MMNMSSSNAFYGKEITRRFTDELPGQNRLEIAVQEPPLDPPWTSLEPVETLLRKDRRDLRRIFAQGDTEETYYEAEREKKRLLNQWKSFQDNLPEISQETSGWYKRRANKTKNEVIKQMKDLEVDTFQDVEDMVESCRNSWVQKDRLLGGKAQERFHKICKSLDMHKGIFEFFPSQNEYVSVLCGSLKMLIQASVTHVQVAEELSRAFKEVIDKLEIVMLEADIMSVEPMRRRVSEIYGKVFEFIRFAMEWWASGSFKKWRQSLGRGLFEDLQGRVATIRQLCDSLYHFARALNSAETRNISPTTDETHTMVSSIKRRDSHLHKLSDAHLKVTEQNQLLLKENERLRQEQQMYRADLHGSWDQSQAEVGTNMKITLFNMYLDLKINEDRQRALQTQADRFTKSLTFESIPDTANNAVTEVFDKSIPWNEWSLDEALQNTRHLEDYIFGSWNRPKTTPLSNISDDYVLTALDRWSSLPSPQLLWLVGPSDSSLPSNMSAVSVDMIATAVRLGIPLISHFCALPEYGRDHPEELATLGLVYNLIRQLLAQMPPIIETDLDMSARRLSKLDGSITSWQEALALLRDLLQLFPKPLLLCVIDGISRLDYRGGSKLCKDFVQILLEYQDDPICWGRHDSTKDLANSYDPSKKILKILFTSSGSTAGLNQQIPLKNKLAINPFLAFTKGPVVKGSID